MAAACTALSLTTHSALDWRLRLTREREPQPVPAADPIQIEADDALAECAQERRSVGS